MKHWDTTALGLRPHSPKILSTTDDARAIALEIPAGESLEEHQVHERAWVTVLEGEVDVTTSDGERVSGAAGLVIEFSPRERHAVHARADARLLLLLTPWPGIGHSGGLTLDEKAHVRERAATHRDTE